MGKHSDNLKMFYNVLRRTSGGADTLAEYARVQSDLNGMQTYNEMNPPTPPMDAINNPQGAITPQAPQSGTDISSLGESGLETP